MESKVHCKEMTERVACDLSNSLLSYICKDRVAEFLKDCRSNSSKTIYRHLVIFEVIQPMIAEPATANTALCIDAVSSTCEKSMLSLSMMSLKKKGTWTFSIYNQMVPLLNITFAPTRSDNAITTRTLNPKLSYCHLDSQVTWTLGQIYLTNVFKIPQLTFLCSAFDISFSSRISAFGDFPDFFCCSLISCSFCNSIISSEFWAFKSSSGGRGRVSPRSWGSGSCDLTSTGGVRDWLSAWSDRYRIATGLG